MRISPEQENQVITLENLNCSTTSEESYDAYEASIEISTMDENHRNSLSPLEKPKKRWLREAAQELAFNNRNNIINNANIVNNNQNNCRPTVLVRAKPINDVENKSEPATMIQEWQGAMALIELANSTSSVPLYTQL